MKCVQVLMRKGVGWVRRAGYERHHQLLYKRENIQTREHKCRNARTKGYHLKLGFYLLEGRGGKEASNNYDVIRYLPALPMGYTVA